jgi:tetratricopeptide (TPR) repeat protein
MSRGRRATFILIAATAFLVKLLLALKTYGTNDVYDLYRISEWSRYLGVSLYRFTFFNHPPSTVHILRFLVWLGKTTPLPFAFWLRLPGILADAGSFWVVWNIFRPRFEEKSVFWLLLLMAAAPASILISGFHGNADPEVIFFLLLAVCFTEKGSIVRGGSAFGLAMSIKVMPIIVIPAIFFYLSGRKRIVFFGTAAAVILICWSPFLFQDPWAIWSQVFGYRSNYGGWGLSFLVSQIPRLAPELSWLNNLFQQFGTYLALGLIFLMAVWMNGTGHAGPRPKLFSQVGFTLFFFLFVAGGFGVQYLAWLVPWVLELGILPTVLLHATSGCFLFAVYNYWSQGIPWYLADSERMGGYNGRYDYLQLLCWLSVVAAFCVAWDNIARGLRAKAAGPVTLSGVAMRCAGAVLFVSSVYALTPARNLNPPPRTGKDEATVRALNTKGSLDLSLILYRAGRFQDSISAANDALRLTPGSADAYNNIAAGYAGMKMWDEAIRAAGEALRLNPGFQPARNNLVWAVEQRNRDRVQ